MRKNIILQGHILQVIFCKDTHFNTVLMRAAVINTNYALNTRELYIFTTTLTDIKMVKRYQLNNHLGLELKIYVVHKIHF